MANFLLHDQFAPITSEIGFIETDPALAAEAFIKWQAPLQAPKVTISRKQVSVDLKSVLQSLLPLTSIEARRYLFVPTTSSWTAYFDNGWRGTDCSSLSYFVTLIKSRGLRIAAVPNTKTNKSGHGRYGALIFELYGPEETAQLNYLRTIALVNDGGKWVFQQSGHPLPFEEAESYTAPKIRDRFTLDLLSNYLKTLGLTPFEEDFYLPSNSSAILVEKNGPFLKGVKEYTLEQARQNF